MFRRIIIYLQILIVTLSVISQPASAGELVKKGLNSVCAILLSTAAIGALVPSPETQYVPSPKDKEFVVSTARQLGWDISEATVESLPFQSVEVFVGQIASDFYRYGTSTKAVFVDLVQLTVGEVLVGANQLRPEERADIVNVKTVRFDDGSVSFQLWLQKSQMQAQNANTNLLKFLNDNPAMQASSWVHKTSYNVFVENAINSALRIGNSVVILAQNATGAPVSRSATQIASSTVSGSLSRALEMSLGFFAIAKLKRKIVGASSHRNRNSRKYDYGRKESVFAQLKQILLNSQLRLASMMKLPKFKWGSGGTYYAQYEIKTGLPKSVVAEIAKAKPNARPEEIREALIFKEASTIRREAYDRVWQELPDGTDLYPMDIHEARYFRLIEYLNLTANEIRAGGRSEVARTIMQMRQEVIDNWQAQIDRIARRASAMGYF